MTNTTGNPQDAGDRTGGDARFAIPLTELERDAHVPYEDRRTEIAEDPAEPVMRPHQLNWIKATGVVGDGRW